MNNTRGQLAGLVLAGGQASRMRAGPDGAPVDKGLLRLHGQPLVAHAAGILRPHTATTFISANWHASTYAVFGTVVADDAVLRGMGPLAGVVSVLHRCRHEWLVVTPVDVVNLPSDFVERLMRHAARSPTLLAHARMSGQDHPLCAIIHHSLGPALHQWLLGGGRSARRWLAETRSVTVDFPHFASGFYNINTPEDLWQAHLITSPGAQRARGGSEA